MAEALTNDRLDSFFEDWVPELEYNVLTNAALAEPDYQPEEIPEEQPVRRERPRREPQRRPQPKPQPKRRVRVRPLPQTEPRTRRRDKSKVLFLLSAAILLIGSLSVVSGYSEVYSRKAEIDDLKEDIEETKMSVGSQLTAAAASQDMNEVYSYAINELGMEEADGSDIVFITLPEKSYTLVPATPKEQRSKVTFHWFSK